MTFNAKPYLNTQQMRDLNFSVVVLMFFWLCGATVTILPAYMYGSPFWLGVAVGAAIFGFPTIALIYSLNEVQMAASTMELALRIRDASWSDPNVDAVMSRAKNRFQ